MISRQNSHWQDSQFTIHLSLKQLLSEEACLGLQALALPRVKSWFAHVYQTLAPYLFNITDPNVLQALKNSDTKRPAPFDLIAFISIYASPIAWQVILCGNNTWCYLESLLAIDRVRQRIIQNPVLWPELAKVKSFTVVKAFQNPALIPFLEKNPTAWPWVLQLAHDEALTVLNLEGIYDYLDQRPPLWQSIFTLSNAFATQALQIKAVRAWLKTSASNPEEESDSDCGGSTIAVFKASQKDDSGSELHQIVTIQNSFVVQVLQQEGIVDLITADLDFRTKIFSLTEKIVADILSIDEIVALLQTLHTENPSQFQTLAKLIFTGIKNPQAVDALSQPEVIEVLSHNFWVWQYIPRIQDDALVELFDNEAFLADLKDCPHNLQNAFDHYDFAKAAYHYLTWDPNASDNTRQAKSYRPTHTKDKIKEVAAFLTALQAKPQTVSKDQLETWLKCLIHHRGEFRRYLVDYTVYSKHELKVLTLEQLIPLFHLTHTAQVHQFTYQGKGRSDSITSVSSDASRHDVSGKKGVALKILSGVDRLSAIAEEEDVIEQGPSSSSSMATLPSAANIDASRVISCAPMDHPNQPVVTPIRGTTTITFVGQQFKPKDVLQFNILLYADQNAF